MNLCPRITTGRLSNSNHVQTIMFHVQLFNNARAEELPTWLLLQESFSVFHGVLRKMSFAVLGRADLGGPVAKYLVHLAKRFLLVHEHQKEDNPLRADDGRTFKADNRW